MPDNRSSAVRPAGPPRSYTSALRSEQAATTRQRILDAAAGCFTRAGYAGTSLAQIAAEAGVSVETVKLNGPKRALLLGAVEQAFAGPGPDDQDSEAVDDGEFLAGSVHAVAAANARTSGLWAAVLAAAASDDQVRSAVDELLARRAEDVRRTVAELIRRGLLDDGLAEGEQQEIADVLSFLLSPESHQQLVGRSHWSQDRYEAWLVDAIRRLVLAGQEDR